MSPEAIIGWQLGWDDVPFASSFPNDAGMLDACRWAKGKRAREQRSVTFRVDWLMMTRRGADPEEALVALMKFHNKPDPNDKKKEKMKMTRPLANGIIGGREGNAVTSRAEFFLSRITEAMAAKRIAQIRS